jgi:ATP-binding cassette subfamily B (MDR/TAP) protein 1
MWLCLYCGFGLGIWYGVKLIILSEENNDDLYTIGKMVIVFWCVTGCGWNLGYIAPHLEAIQIARGTARSVFDIIERQPLIDISSQKGEKIKNNFQTNIEFKGIHFNYPLRPEVKILNDFNLRIKSGETVALVGPSGCGKSTIIQLIQRFYDTNSGDVLIDGKRIKDLNVEWLRQQIGVVGQEPVLFDTSIAENIRLGSKEKTISKEDIERACIEANCHEFIDKLPEKYETYVGDKGAQMSGGQKQRIAIARALISKPKILLLDEATSALDLQSEHLVQSALDRASKGRTTIIVAHRLSTIINSDRIIFIENGKVLERYGICICN